jgi:intracellular sulfur oxidation DsrE/DsrF family protein
MNTFKNTLIQITQNGMGSGDEQLGSLLASNYLTLLNEEEELPRFITLYNAGVKLICKGSTSIEAFKNLEQRGVKIIACKTCLVKFDLLEEVQVGLIGSMRDIIELQKKAEKVINL